jgi:Outer membrane protein beta-barrel domain
MFRSSLKQRSLIVVLAALPPALHAQFVPGSGEVGGTFGYSNLTGVDGNKHLNFGGTGGFNLTDHIQVFGEFRYSPEGSVDGVTAKAQGLGGGVRAHFGSWLRARPFAVIAGGYDRASFSDMGISVGAGGTYAGAGGGVSVYLKRFVIRPEVRYEYLHYGNILNTPNSGAALSGPTVVFETAVLYQVGGHKEP